MNNVTIFQMEGFPVQQNRVYDTVKEAVSCPKGIIKLIQDQFTGIINNSFFNPDLMIYDKNYQNEQGYSGVFKDHLIDVLTIIKKNFLGMNLIEIGCGKGTFLELLINNGFFVTGFDPAYEGTSPFVIKKPFFSEININADAIILRHVLEHIPDPLHFLKFITESNKNEGLIYIEVPSLDWICANRAWFDIYYEHVNYFRIEDFSRFFGKIIDRGYLFGGQYLFVVADLASLRDVKSMNPITNRFTLPDKFFDGIIHAVSYMKAQRGRNIIWGAGSKGVIFAFHTHRLGHTPDYVVDINPVKQGKFLPATGLPIISPEIINNITEEDTIFILNLNYSDEIKKRVGKKVLYFCGE